MKKNLILILVFLLCSIVYAEESNPPVTSVVQTIVIDAGHGGLDKGAQGPTGLLEKNLNLDIALKLRDLILQDPTLSVQGVEVVLTRDNDTKLSAEARAEIANTAQGDIFISIHANAHSVRSARGAETYFLSLKASDEHARKVAEIENEYLEASDEPTSNVAENDDLKLILYDFIHKKYIEESKYLADHIQAEFNRSINNGDRGVRQAPFRVLKGVAMPAVLVEVDFITNPEREKLLWQNSYRMRFAQSMLAAIKVYKQAKEAGLNYNDQ
jgi:N-acetylmuramoyl-L-alanine amidase